MKIPALAYKPFEFADQWACAHVRLQETGRFSYKPTPFFELPTRCASDLAHHCRVVLSTPAQCGKTQTICNLLGWVYTFDPANTLLIMDSLKSCQKLSKNRIRPFLRDQVGVLGLQQGVRVKDRSKDTFNISFGSGANLIIGSSSSPSDLCSFPVKYLFMDEMDRFCSDLKEEGNPVVLAFKRQLRFRGMAVLTSTPTTDTGNITTNFMLGTQEYWCARCHCGEWMRVNYKDIDFTNSTPTYACETCGEVFSESDIMALEHGYAPPVNDTPYKDQYGRIARSFKITAPLVHGIYTWAGLKEEERQALSLGESSLRSFYNTTLGECYHESIGMSLSQNVLLNARKYFNRNTLPYWVDVVTIGVDTQDNRFEAVAVGATSDGRRVAIIERRVIPGDLATRAPWEGLTRYISTFKATTKPLFGKVESKTLHPAVVCIDSGGHFTNDVYAYCFQNPRLIAVKGRSFSMEKQETSLIAKVSTVPMKALGSGVGRVKLTHVNTRFAKDIIRQQLMFVQKSPSTSYWTISSDENAYLDATFFEHLNSEYKETTSNGRSMWRLKPGARNECLDCLVYALAGVETIRLSKGDVPLYTQPLDTEGNAELQSASARKDENLILDPLQIAKEIIQSQSAQTQTNNPQPDRLRTFKRL